jgi:hypothetical protein
MEGFCAVFIRSLPTSDSRRMDPGCLLGVCQGDCGGLEWFCCTAKFSWLCCCCCWSLFRSFWVSFGEKEPLKPECRIPGVKLESFDSVSAIISLKSLLVAGMIGIVQGAREPIFSALAELDWTVWLLGGHLDGDSSTVASIEKPKPLPR